MKLAKTLAVVACAGLLLTGVIGSARHACAQDANSDTADDSSPEAKKGPPIDIGGCWQGDAGKRVGQATVQFNFNELKNKFYSSSFVFQFESGDGVVNVTGDLGGSGTSAGFKFNGTAMQGKDCKLSGSGKEDTQPDPALLSGKYKFKGNCPPGTLSGNFSMNLAGDACQL
jgi:hypothetical protein